MPAGGKWTVQNKRRPGAYINFVVKDEAAPVGTTGVVTAALPMSWGPSGQLITLLGSELNDGTCLKKIGCNTDDVSESLPYRLLLSNCYKAILYRADTGGTKATAVLGTVGSINAKHAGTTGNKILVSITAATPSANYSRVKVFVNSVLQETFDVLTAASSNLTAIVSDWVDFVITSGKETTVIPPTAGSALATGTNGTVVSTICTAYFALVETEIWQCMAVQSTDALFAPLIAAEILKLRDSAGKKVQAVVYNDVSANYEGVIAVKQGFVKGVDTVTTALFPLFVASLRAGSAYNVSNTAYEIADASTIVAPISDDLIADALNEGWFVLSYRQDGAVVVEQDINCFHVFTNDKPYAFCKNRVIRTLDYFANRVALVYSQSFAGKVDNTNTGRMTFKSAVIGIADEMSDGAAITNFGGSDDINVLAGEAIDAIIVDAEIQPVDSMEKLYTTVTVNV